MTNEPLDELYLSWLYSQVGSVNSKSPKQTYWSLLRQLYKTEFVWMVPNDDNRVEDGRDLRDEFISKELDAVDQEWAELGCSVLEILIVLSRWLSFEAEGEPRDWFWHILKNLGITEKLHNDDRYDENVERRVEEIIDTLVWRRYNYDGDGGLFPLKHPDRDQRDVELWYQLNAYLIENE